MAKKKCCNKVKKKGHCCKSCPLYEEQKKQKKQKKKKDKKNKKKKVKKAKK
jgi:hypothetical protein